MENMRQNKLSVLLVMRMVVAMLLHGTARTKINFIASFEWNDDVFVRRSSICIALSERISLI